MCSGLAGVCLGLCASVLCSLFCLCRNYAIADYLQSQGYGETLESFRKESDIVRTMLSW